MTFRTGGVEIEDAQSEPFKQGFMELDPIEIHSSDIALFKRCRRKWGWQSRLSENLVFKGEPAAPLWYGSGFHFAMEDFYGYQRWKTPLEAFEAYTGAFRPSELPAQVDDMVELGTGMLTYFFEHWLPRHPDPYATLVIGGKPQVEVDVKIDITDDVLRVADERGLGDMLRSKWGIPKRRIVCAMTFDRVCVDQDGRIWGLDYKTAKQFDMYNLVTNPQAALYDWGLDVFYGLPVEGIIWQQFLKAVPDPPDRLAGGGFSMNAKQYTTYSIYRKTLMDHYGKVPRAYVNFLNKLAEQETEEGDRFIRRDLLRRNPHQRESEYWKLLHVTVDMLTPDLPLYPNPTRDCSWDCPFRTPCLALDDGSDVEWLFSTEYEKHQGYSDQWRTRIEYPEPSRSLRDNATLASGA